MAGEYIQQPGQQPPPDGKMVERQADKSADQDKGRVELVKQWCKDIEEAKVHWKNTFDQMREDGKFSAGKQWAGQTDKDERYVANITLRHINQRVSSLYAKNPRVRATRKPKIWHTAWDGRPESLMEAQASLQAAAGTGGVTIVGMMPPQKAEMILQDVMEAQQKKQLYDKMARTLELVAQYSLDEPIPKFKTQAKQLVRRTLTCKVGYVKLGYQRIMSRTPDLDAKIKDISGRLQHLQVLADDLADKEIQPDSAEASELKLNLAALQKQASIVMREGLVFSFPRSWAVIVDTGCTQLKGFVGAEWVAEEFIFTPKQVQKIYGVDLGANYTSHTALGAKADNRRSEKKFCAVYEIYDLVGQVCFTICLGHDDFLVAPTEPSVCLEQFHPFFSLSFNDTENPDSIYPPDDVELMRPMAVEYNRAREGKRTHRQANRPATMTAKGVFDKDAKDKLSTHADHEIIETNLSKNDDITKLLVAKPTVPIQPELYETESNFIDVQRVNGDQAADLGGTAGDTATESTIAANSRGVSINSNIDDLDEFLTDLMRAAGQVLLAEMSEKTAKEIAGPGAVWPTLTKEEVARELILEIKAGSSGRPNRGARLAAIEKTAPFLMQIPGIKPRKLADFMLQELDENIEVEEFQEEGLPSIVSMNAMAKPNLAPGPGNEAQGPQGVANAQQPGQSPGKQQNMFPGPGAAPGTKLTP